MLRSATFTIGIVLAGFAFVGFLMLGGLMALDIVKLENAVIIEQMEKRWKQKIADANKVAFGMGFEYVSQVLKQSK